MGIENDACVDETRPLKSITSEEPECSGEIQFDYTASCKNPFVKPQCGPAFMLMPHLEGRHKFAFLEALKNIKFTMIYSESSKEYAFSDTHEAAFTFSDVPELDEFQAKFSITAKRSANVIWHKTYGITYED